MTVCPQLRTDGMSEYVDTKPSTEWNHSTPPTLSWPMTTISCPLSTRFQGNSTYTSRDSIATEGDWRDLTNHTEAQPKAFLGGRQKTMNLKLKPIVSCHFILINYYIQVAHQFSLTSNRQVKTREKVNESGHSARASSPCCWYVALSKTSCVWQFPLT